MKYSCSIVVLIVISLVLSGCGPKGPVEGSKREVKVNCHEIDERKNDKIKVTVGDEFTLSLCSNITTGFGWSEQANISDIEVIEQVGHLYKDLESSFGEHPLIGAAGEEVWTFKTMKKGQSTVSVEYSQPWEGGETAVRTFVLSVKVQ